MNEKELGELLQFIGSGYFHTYQGHDETKQALYEACEELRSRGLLEIHSEKPDHIVWRAVRRS